jgi:hypothetical protein
MTLSRRRWPLRQPVVARLLTSWRRPSWRRWQRIQDLVSTYADLRSGGTGASVIALAERHGAVRIATLNRRHFAVVRPRHAGALELPP